VAITLGDFIDEPGFIAPALIHQVPRRGLLGPSSTDLGYLHDARAVTILPLSEGSNDNPIV
jgi:hypothetical protein